MKMIGFVSLTFNYIYMNSNGSLVLKMKTLPIVRLEMKKLNNINIK